MKKRMTRLAVSVAGLGFALSAAAAEPLVRFEGGTGVHPLRTNQGVTVSNDARGVPPGGTPWAIRAFKAHVKQDGSISAKGEGLVLAGGNRTGTGGPRQVVATLFCGAQELHSPPADMSLGGNFEIEGVLSGVPNFPCGTEALPPVLLIRNFAPPAGTPTAPPVPGNWFTAGILVD